MENISEVIIINNPKIKNERTGMVTTREEQKRITKGEFEIQKNVSVFKDASALYSFKKVTFLRKTMSTCLVPYLRRG